MMGRKGSGLTQRFVQQVAVGRHIHTENDTQEVNMHPHIETPNKAAATLTEVSTEAVERHTECGDVQNIPDEEVLTVQGDNGRAPAKDGSVRVVAHLNTKRTDRLVGDECRTVREHQIRCTSVRHNETERVTGRDSPEEREDQL